MKVNLDAVVSRAMPPEPWSEGDKIPWDEPAFSERMLAEHLSQAHDAASRRTETIEAQVAWIHEALLGGQRSRVLDLGCGPGLYASRLSRLGHRVRGIDFSPASIRHAREEAEREGLELDYVLGDVREAEYGGPHDLVMFIFGELNVFRREEAVSILAKARRALVPGGRLLIELHSFEAARAIGHQPARSQSLESGLFSERPHQLLEEAFWDDERAVAIHCWFVIDRETDEVERYADAMQAYTADEYIALLDAAGFNEVAVRDDWPSAPSQAGELVAYRAVAAGSQTDRRTG